ncbi:MAG: ATP-dependent zinc protease, partial [Rubricella sp.]
IVSLPDLCAGEIRAKIDTGAKTSALHAPGLERNGAFAHFMLGGHRVEARVRELREIRSSNGQTEERPVIETTLAVAGKAFPIELTLTDRREMSFPLLVGRDAIRGRALVDPARSWVHGKEGSSA